MKPLRIINLFFLILLLFVFTASAKEITEGIEFSGINTSAVTDAKLSTHAEATEFTIKSSEEIFGIFIEYNKIPDAGHIGDRIIAEKGFLHEFIELDGETKVTLSYEYADICNIRVFGNGEIPSDVERWEAVKDEVDVLLLATHSDDDQLFFAGLLPTYTSRGADVAVAYFVNHFDTYNRTHELLRGLWHCGVRIYPEISPFPDGYSESIDGAKSYLSSQGISDTDIDNYNKMLIEKYKPQIVVLHDFKGEYGHGAHMLATDSFIKALENASDSPVKKVYVHLYEENVLTLDIDTPIDTFDGKTAFQVSQDAFQYHESQHWTWFYGWIYGKSEEITHSSQIRSYNPAFYGLYYTEVGPDTGTNDMLENITLYKEQVIETEVPATPLPEEAPEPVIEEPAKKVISEDTESKFPIFLAVPGILILLIIIITTAKRKKK